MSDEVLTSVENGVLTITLNRPKAKNAVNKALAEQVAAAIDELENNDELRVAILTGFWRYLLFRYGFERLCQW